ncbi:MAG: hypothetical protein HYV63_15290 [Candidatus Schekmanbacteria bacterium]|nr:hypothetical protein [Candidatus Schekmanbacteria bacterium]
MKRCSLLLAVFFVVAVNHASAWVPGKYWKPGVTQEPRAAQSLTSGESGISDAATSPTIFTIRELKYENGGWAPCAGCIALVYSGTAWLGTYTTDANGYVYVRGAQYSTTKPYLIGAGWAGKDDSCNYPTAASWNETWTGQFEFGVRRASSSSVTIYVSAVKGISKARYNDLTPRNDKAFADNVYGTVQYPVYKPFGFENFLGNAGNTLLIELGGDLSRPNSMKAQLVSDYHVFSIESGDPDDVKDHIAVTWDANGKYVAGWNVKTCASQSLNISTDGYPTEVQIKCVDLLNPCQVQTPCPSGVSCVQETQEIKHEFFRWKR